MSASIIINEKELTMNGIPFNLFKIQKQIHIHHSLSATARWFRKIGLFDRKYSNKRTSEQANKILFFCYLNIKQYGNTSFLLCSVWLVSDAMPFELEMWLHIPFYECVEWRMKLKFWRFKHKLLALSIFSCCYIRPVYVWFIDSFNRLQNKFNGSKQHNFTLLTANFSHKIAEKTTTTTTTVQCCGGFVMKKGKNDEAPNPNEPMKRKRS